MLGRTATSLIAVTLPAARAADAAVALATRFGAPLRLVHASAIATAPLTADEACVVTGQVVFVGDESA